MSLQWIFIYSLLSLIKEVNSKINGILCFLAIINFCLTNQFQLEKSLNLCEIVLSLLLLLK